MTPPQARKEPIYQKLGQDSPDEDPVNQLRVIQRLNGYLAWHHFPIRMGNQGICRGLSTVCAKYILEGKLPEFKHILAAISGDIQPDSENDNVINHFAVEVTLTQSPERFEKNMTQKKSLQCLSIDGNKLQSSLNFGMYSKDENWQDLITSLDLNENEAMVVSASNHAICVKKERNGQYMIYDPNYLEGFKYFHNEAALIQEFHNCLVNKTDRNTPFLGLHINVLRHPTQMTSRLSPLPKDLQLYNAYVIPQEINTSPDITELNRNLLYAVTYGDEVVIDSFIRAGATDFQQAARRAMLEGNAKALRALLPSIQTYQPAYIEECFETALFLGSDELLDTLMEAYDAEYNAFFDESNIQNRLFQAIRGGNENIITALLDHAKNGFSENNTHIDDPITRIFKSKNSYSDIITLAMRHDYADCIRALMKFGQKSIFAFSNEEKMNFLLMAIRMNQALTVRYLLKEVPPEAIKSLNMSTNAIERTELSILRELKKHGMPFSSTAAGIMQKKEHQIIEFGLNIHIILRKFTDYLMEMVFRNAGVSIDAKKFKLFTEPAFSQPINPTTLLPARKKI